MSEPVSERPWYELAFAKKRKVYGLPKLPVPVCDTHAHMLSFWGVDPAHALARAVLAGVSSLVTLVDPVGDGMAPDEFRTRLDGWCVAARELLAEAAAAGAFPPAFEGAGVCNGVASAHAGAVGVPSLLDGGIRYLAGVHPYGAARYSDEVHGQLVSALADPLCVGLGEFGLDYHFDSDDDVSPAPHAVQRACMERQLDLAVRHNAPVELHLRHEADDAARSSHADALAVLREVGVPRAGCVLHCFGEDAATMEPFVELGCSVAFGGAATFKRNDEVREAFAACPLDRILFETDCPFMAPHPLRGMECEPAMSVLTAAVLAHDRAERTGERQEEILTAAWRNARRMFFEPPEK